MMDSARRRTVRRFAIYTGAPTLALLVWLALFWYSAVAASKRAVAEFHHRFEAGQDDVIYDSADPMWRGFVDREMNKRFFSTLRTKLGRVRESSIASVNVVIQGIATGAIVLESRTRFSREDKATETFTWHIRWGRPSLYGYRIGSNQLLAAYLEQQGGAGTPAGQSRTPDSTVRH